MHSQLKTGNEPLPFRKLFLFPGGQEQTPSLPGYREPVSGKRVGESTEIKKGWRFKECRAFFGVSIFCPFARDPGHIEQMVFDARLLQLLAVLQNILGCISSCRPAAAFHPRRFRCRDGEAVYSQCPQLFQLPERLIFNIPNAGLHFMSASRIRTR